MTTIMQKGIKVRLCTRCCKKVKFESFRLKVSDCTFISDKIIRMHKSHLFVYCCYSAPLVILLEKNPLMLLTFMSSWSQLTDQVFSSENSICICYLKIEHRLVLRNYILHGNDIESVPDLCRVLTKTFLR